MSLPTFWEMFNVLNVYSIIFMTVFFFNNQYNVGIIKWCIHLFVAIFFVDNQNDWLWG